MYMLQFIFKLLLIYYLVGILSFMYCFEIEIVDAIYNTSIIITTLGGVPTVTIETDIQKIFVSVYSILGTILFFIFISIMSVEIYKYNTLDF